MLCEDKSVILWANKKGIVLVIQILIKQEESRNWTWKCAFRAGWVKSFIFLFVKSNLDMLIVQKCLRCISFS